MIIKESLHNKILSAQDLKYRINSWGIYDEGALVLFYKDFSINANKLNKLLEYSALSDKLVLAVPHDTPGDKLFEFTNLQVIDAIVLYQDVAELLGHLENARFSFEDIKAPELTQDDKKRVLSL